MRGIYCTISFNSDKGVTCDTLSEILVSDTFQKDGDRVIPQPARRQSGPLIAIFSIGASQCFRTRAMCCYVTQNSCDISDNLKRPVTRDVRIEWNGTVPLHQENWGLYIKHNQRKLCTKYVNCAQLTEFTLSTQLSWNNPWTVNCV